MCTDLIRWQWSRIILINCARARTCPSSIPASRPGAEVYLSAPLNGAPAPVDCYLCRYDPYSKAWDEISPMLSPRLYPSALAFEGELVVMGGQIMDTAPIMGKVGGIATARARARARLCD